MTPARFPHSDTPGSTLGCQLPRAYRRLLRPSSALDAKASTMCPSQLVTHTTNPTHPPHRPAPSPAPHTTGHITEDKHTQRAHQAGDAHTTHYKEKNSMLASTIQISNNNPTAHPTNHPTTQQPPRHLCPDHHHWPASNTGHGTARTERAGHQATSPTPPPTPPPHHDQRSRPALSPGTGTGLIPQNPNSVPPTHHTHTQRCTRRTDRESR
jgi:hypothetical protein